MKYYGDVLSAVKGFVHDNLGKQFIIEKGAFEGETVTVTVTVAGYTEQDSLGVPSVIVELPDTLPMKNQGWSPEDKQGLYDRILLDAAPLTTYWYVDIEDLEKC